MDQEQVAENVTARVAGRGKEYREYFNKMLKKWKVKSPSEIPDDKKDDFFEEVDKGWNSADESGEDGKKEAAIADRVAMRVLKEAGCEKLPAGPMRENCEKKKKDGDGEKKEKKSSEKTAVRPPTGPYASVIFEKNRVTFTMLPDGSQNVRTGSEPYRKDPEAAIARVFKLFKMNGIKGSDVEILA